MTRYEAIAVRETPQEDVVRTLLDLYRSRGFQQPDHRGVLPQDEILTFEVSPLRDRWVLVFPEEAGSGEEDAAHLSRTLSCDVVRLAAVVGSALEVDLFRAADEAVRQRQGQEPPAALLALGGGDRDEAARILRGPTTWEDLHRVAEALGIRGTRDADHIEEAILDPEEAGYRKLVLRKPAALGLVHRIRQLFQKPDLTFGRRGS